MKTGRLRNSVNLKKTETGYRYKIYLPPHRIPKNMESFGNTMQWNEKNEAVIDIVIKND